MMDLTVEEYLAVPYVLVVESVALPTGEWMRRASYPELKGCVAEGIDIVDVINSLDGLREGLIRGMLQRNEDVPVPRPPLSDGYRRLPLDGSLWPPSVREEEGPHVNKGRE